MTAQNVIRAEKLKELQYRMDREAKRKKQIKSGLLICLNVILAMLILAPLLYAVSIAFMPSCALFTLDLNLIPK